MSHSNLIQNSLMMLIMLVTVNAEIAVPLKYLSILSNIWRTLEMPLINHDTNLILTWLANCVIYETTRDTAFAKSYAKLYAQVSDILRLFGRLVYQFGCPNTGAQKTLFKFSFFNCISTKKCVEVAINDFIMHLIISKWLRRQKWRQEKNNETGG